jgi:hypothetical protein
MFRIRLGSRFNQISGYVSGFRRAKMTEIPCFEVLDVLFRGLKASSVAWTSFMEA